MSSFFDKVHGRAASMVKTPKVHAKAIVPRPKPEQRKSLSSTVVSPSRIEATARVVKKEAKFEGKVTGRIEAPNGVQNGNSIRKKEGDSAPMRRTQSSSTVPPPTKKRKTDSIAVQKEALPRDVSRLATLAPSNEVKRRRTASPAYRIHRSPSDDETDFSEPVKLFRDDTPDIAHQKMPVERGMANPRAGEDVSFRHARELVCVVDRDSFVPEDPENPALEVTVKLPFGEEMYTLIVCDGNSRFKLLRPKKNDEYHPTGDIVDTVSLLLTYFLPSDTLPPDTMIQDYIYRLSKAIKSTTPEHALPLLTPINDKLVSLRPLTPVIEKMTSMPRDLLHRITMQCYTRQVSPHLDGLRKYAAFSSTVYGELLFPFLSKLFSDLDLSPGQTFLDLGCGVGNCLIQAAGETGCTAIGIEIMDHAATLATAQIAEFEARMRAWGLSHGEITFHHGDILSHPAIPEIMQ